MMTGPTGKMKCVDALTMLVKEQYSLLEIKVYISCYMSLPRKEENKNTERFPKQRLNLGFNAAFRWPLFKEFAKVFICTRSETK
jgi:hypothetical protein